MYAMGHMQSKCHPKSVIRDVRKMKFISYNDTYFYIVFCSLFVKFCCKSCKIRGKEENYKPTCLVITFECTTCGRKQFRRYDTLSTVSFYQSPYPGLPPWHITSTTGDDLYLKENTMQ